MADKNHSDALPTDAPAAKTVTEWLSFSLDNVIYAVDILRVREIRIWEKMTRIPYAKPFVLGLINLRGAIVPIIDLRARFHQPHREADKQTVVLVLSVESSQGEKTMGIVVDQISDVVELEQADIASSSAFDLTIDEQFVKGITDVKGMMAVLLDVDTVLSVDDF